jgi:hypothetical protein
MSTIEDYDSLSSRELKGRLKAASTEKCAKNKI